MRYSSRRATICLATMILSVLLLTAGIGMDMFNRTRQQPMASISMACSVAGLAGGVSAYLVNRLD